MLSASHSPGKTVKCRCLNRTAKKQKEMINLHQKPARSPVHPDRQNNDRHQFSGSTLMRVPFYKTVFGFAVACILLSAAPSAHAGKTLDAVKQRGQLVCGVTTGIAGFAVADS